MIKITKCGKTLPTGYVCASELPCPLHTVAPIKLSFHNGLHLCEKCNEYACQCPVNCSHSKAPDTPNSVNVCENCDGSKKPIKELEYMEEAVALGVVGEASKEVKFGVSNSVRQYNLLTNKINEIIKHLNGK